MSVLIKGMEMPKEGCKDCLLVKRKPIFDICPFLKREVNGNVERGGKPLDCPLVPVPPHGRLIDADALIAEHEQVCSRSMKFNLDLAPTIIEAEEGE